MKKDNHPHEKYSVAKDYTPEEKQAELLRIISPSKNDKIAETLFFNLKQEDICRNLIDRLKITLQILSEVAHHTLTYCDDYTKSDVIVSAIDSLLISIDSLIDATRIFQGISSSIAGEIATESARLTRVIRHEQSDLRGDNPYINIPKNYERIIGNIESISDNFYGVFSGLRTKVEAKLLLKPELRPPEPKKDDTSINVLTNKNRKKTKPKTEWKPPRGYIGNNEIKTSTLKQLKKRFNLSEQIKPDDEERTLQPSTIQYWRKQDMDKGGDIEKRIISNPHTSEVYYPNKWFKTYLSTYIPKGNYS